MSDLVVFSYSNIDPDIAERLRGQAERIVARLKRHTTDMIEAGRDLAAVREHVDGKTFAAWVEAECGITVRLAQLYIGAAEVFGDCEIISRVPPTAVMKLAAKSTPPDMREQFLARFEAGERIRVAEIDNKLREARERRRDEERQAELDARTPAAKAAEKRRREKLKQQQEEADRRYREEQDRAWDMAVEAATIIRGRLTVEEWLRVREILQPRYSASHRLYNAMGINKFLDPEVDGYMPAAFRAYENADMARLVEENTRLTDLVDGYAEEARKRSERWSGDASDLADDFDPSQLAFLTREAA